MPTRKGFKELISVFCEVNTPVLDVTELPPVALQHKDWILSGRMVPSSARCREIIDRSPTSSSLWAISSPLCSTYHGWGFVVVREVQTLSGGCLVECTMALIVGACISGLVWAWICANCPSLLQLFCRHNHVQPYVFAPYPSVSSAYTHRLISIAILSPLLFTITGGRRTSRSYAQNPGSMYFDMSQAIGFVWRLQGPYCGIRWRGLWSMVLWFAYLCGQVCGTQDLRSHQRRLNNFFTFSATNLATKQQILL